MWIVMQIFKNTKGYGSKSAVLNLQNSIWKKKINVLNQCFTKVKRGKNVNMFSSENYIRNPVPYIRCGMCLSRTFLEEEVFFNRLFFLAHVLNGKWLSFVLFLISPFLGDSSEVKDDSELRLSISCPKMTSGLITRNSLLYLHPVAASSENRFCCL